MLREHSICLLLLMLNLLVHIELALNLIFNVREGRISRIGKGSSVRIDRPFACGVGFILFWNDGSVRFLHHLQVDRSVYCRAFIHGLIISSAISTVSLIAMAIVSILDPISMRIGAILWHSKLWSISFPRTVNTHSDIFIKLLLLIIVDLILVLYWGSIIYLISAGIDLINALSHATFRLLCIENASLRSLRVPLSVRWVD